MSDTPARIVLGVDGGGTKTHAVLADLSGDVLGFGESGASNWEIVGLGGTAGAVSSAVDAACANAGIEPDSIAASLFALAGCDWNSDVSRLDSAIPKLGANERRRIINDAAAVLSAGAPTGYGIASVAGTGGSTTGRNRDGAQFRTFAVSIGEASGASGIARAGLDAVARAYHGQSEPTGLTDRILAATSFRSVPELFEAISRGRPRGIGAQLAPLVFSAAEDGDECARSIASDAGASHARDVVGVARRLAMLDHAFDVVCSGGVHTAGNAEFDAAFRTTLAADIPDAIPVLLTMPPVFGAVLLAYELAGIDPTSLRQRVATAMSEIR